MSLQSAHAIINHVNRDKYEVVLIGITRQGEWFRYDGDYEEIAADTWHESETFCHPAWLSPNRSVHGMVEIRDNKRIETWLDAVFPVLHGKNGEDGTVQGVSRTSRDSGYRMWPAVFCIVHGQWTGLINWQKRQES